MVDSLASKQPDDAVPVIEPEVLARPTQSLGLPLALYRLPCRGIFRNTYAEHCGVGVALSGSGRRWAVSGSHRTELYTSPRMVDILEAGTSYDRFGFDGEAGEVVFVELPAGTVGRWLLGDAPRLRLGTRHAQSDDDLADLVVMLWKEACQDSPRGTLYTEGLTMALLGLLSQRHSAGQSVTLQRVGPFGRTERSRILAFIDSEIGGDLRVERMAQVVSMSPFHFSRVFRASFQQSPHAFVMARRLDMACAALRREPDRSIADIANGCGFANQAHFSELFRRRIGMTPLRWRRRI